MLTADVIEAVVGLASNLFYGAGIPAALLVCRKKKPAQRRGKVLIVNGDATYQPGKAQNFLTDDHLRTLADAVHAFANIEKLAHVVPVDEIAANGHNLNISRYVQTGADAEAGDVRAPQEAWLCCVRHSQPVSRPYKLRLRLACPSIGITPRSAMLWTRWPQVSASTPITARSAKVRSVF
jgi:hypothetical protein